jgi:hypothetical protein
LDRAGLEVNGDRYALTIPADRNGVNAFPSALKLLHILPTISIPNIQRSV